MIFQGFTHVDLFGGSPLMGRLAKSLLADGFTVAMYTAPRQASEVEEVHGVKRVVTDDIEEALRGTDGAGCMGIGMGHAWPLSERVRSMYGTNLVDFMSIPYPQYLGGAHVTHAMLRGETEWGCCMQLITENTIQGECHDGAVIYRRVMPFDADLDEAYVHFISAFVLGAADGLEFTPEDAVPVKTTFFPRLNTERQGWVDWSLRRQEVMRFIRAFDKPYRGARTMINDAYGAHIVTVHDPIDLGTAAFHPFQAGIITCIDNETASVALYGGSVALTIRDDLGRWPGWLRPGMRLHTDRQTLDKAMTYCPCYTATGDVSQKAANT